MFSTLAVIFAALTACNAALPLYPPIIGGEYSSILTYPHHVGVQSEEGLCGGTIIAESWVLTAAHCIPDKSTAMFVRSGTSYKAQAGTLHPVSNIYVHYDYHEGAVDRLPNFDIALLKLEEPMKFDRIRQPAVMVGVDYQVRPGTWGIICGWGRTDKNPVTGQLQSVAVPLMGWKECQHYYDPINKSVPRDNFCGGYIGVGGRDSCQGDSGGPVMIDGRLAGIVSWGEGCGDKRYPGAYVSVGVHRMWIYKIAGV